MQRRDENKITERPGTVQFFQSLTAAQSTFKKHSFLVALKLKKENWSQHCLQLDVVVVVCGLDQRCELDLRSFSSREREREKDREIGRKRLYKRERERERERETCTYVCVRDREGENVCERELEMEKRIYICEREGGCCRMLVVVIVVRQKDTHTDGHRRHYLQTVNYCDTVSFCFVVQQQL